jgi:heat shock protein HslJ
MMPTRVAVAVLLFPLLALACSAPAPPSQSTPGAHPASLAGSIWSVASVSGRPPVIGSRPNVTFSATDVGGSAGCNSFGGTYRYDPSSGRIELSENVFMTEMACPGGRDEFESAFILALTKATDASLDDEGRLVLRGTGGQVLLVAAR